MANPAGHLSDDDLLEIDGVGDADGDQRNRRRAQTHVATCKACRERRQALIRLRELLAETGHRERLPVRDVVPSAMVRLRLRRHSVTNANELLGGFAAFVRALASLFSLPATDQRFGGRSRGAKDDRHE